MSTIASLISLIDPSAIRPWSQGMQDVNREQIGRQQAQTGLIELQRLKQSQASEEEVMAYYRAHPEQLVGGASILGSLGPAGAPPGAQPPPGAITQSPLGGGPAQQIPAYPDASRYAGVSPQGGGPIPPDVLAQTMPQVTPLPQSTIASLGPQPQGPPQGQQHPLLELARRDPRAALMLQQQMQGQQDRQWKMQEQQLSLGVKVAEFVARELQGVTDQASLDAARERIRQVHPQAAAQVPQMYSKDAVEQVQQRGIAIAERANTQLAEAKARNLDMETRMFPELAKRLGLEGEAQAPAGGTPATNAPAAGQQARPAPPEFESAMTDANRLYPQVPVTRIKSIIAAESNFDPKAVSAAGAKGPMQLMDATAKDMGVDDPFDIKQNVRGGTRYYAQMLTKYGGDERKALTAYNWGPQNLDKVGGDVTRAPAETQAYVQRVLGGGGSTARAEAADPRITQLDAKIAQRTRDSQIASLMKNESLSTRLNDDANRLKDERARLLEESRRQQERSEEIPRAAQKQTAELEAKQKFERERQGQAMLPEDQLKLQTALRTDIRAEPTHKLYQEVRNGYQNVRIGADLDSSEGDLALIYGIAKILDPQGVVRDQDFQTVAAAQGQLQRWFNAPQRFFEGDRLRPENRQQLLNMAHRLATEKLTTAQKELRAVYEPLAKRGNIDFNQLLPLEDLKPLARATSGLTPEQQALIEKHRKP